MVFPAELFFQKRALAAQNFVEELENRVASDASPPQHKVLLVVDLDQAEDRVQKIHLLALAESYELALRLPAGPRVHEKQIALLVENVLDQVQPLPAIGAERVLVNNRRAGLFAVFELEKCAFDFEVVEGVEVEGVLFEKFELGFVGVELRDEQRAARFIKLGQLLV